MKVLTTWGNIIELDNLPFDSWLYCTLLKLRYHYPSLRLEAVDVRSKKKVRVALQELDLDWNEVKTLNP